MGDLSIQVLQQVSDRLVLIAPVYVPAIAPAPAPTALLFHDFLVEPFAKIVV